MEHSVSLEKNHGAMSLFVDGKAQNFFHFKVNESCIHNKSLEIIDTEVYALAREKIPMIWIPIFIKWNGPDDYDFTEMDDKINHVLAEYRKGSGPDTPEPMIVIRIQTAVFTPDWYVEKFMVDGKFTNMIRFRSFWGDSEPFPLKLENKFATRNWLFGEPFEISPGDKFWDKEALDCLKAIVKHAQSQPYHQHVFGYLPCAFSTNEWFFHSDAPNSCCEFSEPTQRAFFDYLKEKGFDCSCNPVPTPIECFRGPKKYGQFLDPEDFKDCRVEEFSLFFNNRIAEIMEKFAHLIKSLYPDKNKLVGCFYGYTFELAPIYNLAQSGHIALRRLMKCPDIDFFCSPLQYRYRSDLLPFTFSQVNGVAADSMRLHGKLVFCEDDNPDVQISNGRRDEWHDKMFHMRDAASAATHGQHLWWYSLGDRWYSTEHRQKLIGKLHQIAEKELELDRTPCAEVAVIADERSISAMRLDPTFWREVMMDTYSYIYPSGTPFDIFELETFLDLADKKQYKAVVFLNLFRTDAEVEKKINALKNSGRTLFFLRYPGMAFDDAAGKRTINADNASRLTGIEFKINEKNLQATIWIDPDKNDFLGNGEDIRFGTQTEYKYSLYSVDAKAENVGWNWDGTPGFVVKRFADWTSVFISAPIIPGKVWNKLFKNAGVHCYAEPGDVAYANASMVCYSSSSRGDKKLTMPGPEVLCDVMTGEKIELDEHNSCSLTMRRHEVRWFYREKK